MPRTIDQDRSTRQRTRILSAAYRRFAVSGYERTTTAAICREAGISSGTFFHYFPTKLDALVMLLAAGDTSAAAHYERIEQAERGLPAILDHVVELERELATEHALGFAAAVSGASHHPEVSAAQTAAVERLRAFIARQVGAGLVAGEIRDDVPPGLLVSGVTWMLEGAARTPSTPPRDAGELLTAVRSLLAPGLIETTVERPRRRPRH